MVLGQHRKGRKMSKHTKGPWKYQEESDAYTHIVRAKNNYMICHLLQDSSGTTEANARLIAAAPTMYETLKNIVKVPDNIACPSVKNFAKEAIKEINND